MKRIGSVTILLAILAMPAHAQRQGRTREVSADAIIRLQDRLDLSEDQIERVKAAQGAEREVRDALRLETRAMRDRLRDEEITRAEFREEMESRRSTEMDGTRAYRETLEGILTDEQRSQLRDVRRQANRGRQGVRGGRSESPRARARGQRSRGSQAQRGGRDMRPQRGGRNFGPSGNFGPRARRRR